MAETRKEKRITIFQFLMELCCLCYAKVTVVSLIKKYPVHSRRQLRRLRESNKYRDRALDQAEIEFWHWKQEPDATLCYILMKSVAWWEGFAVYIATLPVAYTVRRQGVNAGSIVSGKRFGTKRLWSDRCTIPGFARTGWVKPRKPSE